MPFLRIPEGTRCSTVFLPPITRVCPALCPPWKRTTPCAWSVSQSTTFPLPSSPHWVPMTTTFLATVSALAQFAHGPLAAALNELPVAVGLNAFHGVSWKPDHDDLPGGSQLADRRGEPRVDFGILGQDTPGALEHRAVSIELRKDEQGIACRFRRRSSHRAQRRQILALQRFVQFRFELGTDAAVSANRAEHGDVAEIEAHPGNPARRQRLDEEL